MARIPESTPNAIPPFDAASAPRCLNALPQTPCGRQDGHQAYKLSPVYVELAAQKMVIAFPVDLALKILMRDGSFTTAPAAAAFIFPGYEWINETFCRRRQELSGPDDGFFALEFIMGEIDSGTMQRGQGLFETIAQHSALKVLEGTASQSEHLMVGMPRIGEDCVTYNVQKTVFPVSHLIKHYSFGIWNSRSPDPFIDS